MHSQSSAQDNTEKEIDIGETTDQIFHKLEMLQKFVARRFDEISMEINATSQQVDMAETGISTKFSEILDVIQAISYRGGGNTAANAGVELDAVVDMTEEAANKILDAAGRIAAAISSEKDWDNKEAREHARDIISQDVEEIFMACSFQDLTSQRIRKTLDNLKSIEDRLGNVLERLGVQRVDHSEDIIQEHKATSQADIDALFGNKD
jgi:chemotaxis protein CheZ